MGRFNYFRVFEQLLVTATHPAKLTTFSKATARNWRFGVTLYIFRMCSSQTPPLRSSLTSIQKQQLHSENLLSPTPQRMDTLSLSITYLFRASDMFKKKATTSDGFRCHILTIHKKRDDASADLHDESNEYAEVRVRRPKSIPRSRWLNVSIVGHGESFHSERNFHDSLRRIRF